MVFDNITSPSISDEPGSTLQVISPLPSFSLWSASEACSREIISSTIDWKSSSSRSKSATQEDFGDLAGMLGGPEAFETFRWFVVDYNNPAKKIA